MREKRRNEIAYQLMVRETRKYVALRDLKGLEREAGAMVKEKEFRQKGINPNELIRFEEEVFFDACQNVLRIELEGIERMDKERRNEIAYQYILKRIRRNYSFRDIHNFKREIGNLIKEDELLEKGISATELVNFAKEAVFHTYENAFNEEKMEGLDI